MAFQQVNNQAPNKRQFICPDCQKTFTRLAGVERHLASIHLKIWHTCPVAGCMFQARRVDKLKPHFKKAHGMSAKEVQDHLLHLIPASSTIDKTIRSIDQPCHERDKTRSAEYTQTNWIMPQYNTVKSSGVWPRDLPPQTQSFRSNPALPQATMHPYTAYAQAQHNDGGFHRGCNDSIFDGDNTRGWGSITLSSQTFELLEDPNLEYTSSFSNYKY